MRVCCWMLMLCLLCTSFSTLKGDDGPTNDQNWTSWRGPTANGKAHASAKPPTTWSDTENIAWSLTLKGEGSATPIVWQDRIFVLSAEKTETESDKPAIVDPQDKTTPPKHFYRFWITCLNRHTGALIWQRSPAELVPHEGKHDTHTYAAGSPTTDGEYVFASFGSFGIYCYSLDGKLVWQTDLGDMQTRLGWGEAVTPVLCDDRLIVNWDQEGGSFITALDKATGQVIWRTERPQEVTSWNTPLVVSTPKQKLIVVNGTERVRAYEVQSGKEIWQCGGQTTNAIPSPIQFDDYVVCMSGFRGSAAMAIPIDSSGDITGSAKIAWTVGQGTPYVPSPALSDRRLYFTAGTADVLTCLDVTTGKSIGPRKRLTGIGSIYASPLVADGHLYFAGRDGTVIVLTDDESLSLVATNRVPGPLDASPIAVGRDLYLRTWDKLYCIRDNTK